MTEPAWIAIARKYIGLREIKGAEHHPQILKWWKDTGAAWFADDETPWCGAFVGGVLAEAGLPVLPKGAGAGAQAWLDLPVALVAPAVGAVVVFWRDKPTSRNGHVGFIVGKDQRGNLMVLGGNQGDEVSVKPFSTDRVKGYRWPSKYPLAERFNLPIIHSDGKVSVNEA